MEDSLTKVGVISGLFCMILKKGFNFFHKITEVFPFLRFSEFTFQNLSIFWAIFNLSEVIKCFREVYLI